MQVKAEHPANYLKDKSPSPIIAFYFEFNRLKSLFRQGWLKRGVDRDQCESVAEHSHGVALLAMLIADAHFPELDALKIARLALIHDLGEVYAGDLTPADGVAAAEKHRREREAVTQILDKLPNGEKYVALWDEYERGESAEARFVRQIDRLEMCLQASVYECLTGEDLTEFYDSAAPVIKDPRLAQILKELKQIRP